VREVLLDAPIGFVPRKAGAVRAAIERRGSRPGAVADADPSVLVARNAAISR